MKPSNLVFKTLANNAVLNDVRDKLAKATANAATASQAGFEDEGGYESDQEANATRPASKSVDLTNAPVGDADSIGSCSEAESIASTGSKPKSKKNKKPAATNQPTKAEIQATFEHAYAQAQASTQRTSVIAESKVQQPNREEIERIAQLQREDAERKEKQKREDAERSARLQREDAERREKQRREDAEREEKQRREDAERKEKQRREAEARLREEQLLQERLRLEYKQAKDLERNSYLANARVAKLNGPNDLISYDFAIKQLQLALNIDFTYPADRNFITTFKNSGGNLSDPMNASILLEIIDCYFLKGDYVQAYNDCNKLSVCTNDNILRLMQQKRNECMQKIINQGQEYFVTARTFLSANNSTEALKNLDRIKLLYSAIDYHAADDIITRMYLEIEWLKLRETCNSNALTLISRGTSYITFTEESEFQRFINLLDKCIANYAKFKQQLNAEENHYHQNLTNIRQHANEKFRLFKLEISWKKHGEIANNIVNKYAGLDEKNESQFKDYHLVVSEIFTSHQLFLQHTECLSSADKENLRILPRLLDIAKIHEQTQIKREKRNAIRKQNHDTEALVNSYLAEVHKNIVIGELNQALSKLQNAKNTSNDFNKEYPEDLSNPALLQTDYFEEAIKTLATATTHFNMRAKHNSASIAKMILDRSLEITPGSLVEEYETRLKIELTNIFVNNWVKFDRRAMDDHNPLINSLAEKVAAHLQKSNIVMRTLHWSYGTHYVQKFEILSDTIKTNIAAYVPSRNPSYIQLNIPLINPTYVPIATVVTQTNGDSAGADEVPTAVAVSASTRCTPL